MPSLKLQRHEAIATLNLIKLAEKSSPSNGHITQHVVSLKGRVKHFLRKTGAIPENLKD